jgi:histidinol-phosphate aminotransferase
MQVSPEIESLIPYKPGKPIEETKRELGLTDVVKLASNENALGPSPMAIAALKEATNDLARYPDPTCYRLREKLAEKWNLSADQMVIGNGSNELIDLLIRVFCEPGDKIITPEKSFVAYSVCAQAARVGKREIPIDESFQWDVSTFLQSFDKTHTSREKILFIANPNNPTGTYKNATEMEQLLEALGHRDDLLIVIDEAYNEFVRADDFPDSSQYLKKYKNVLLSRTFSKIYGLAGLRVGALLGDPTHLQWIHRVRNPFNVNTLAQEAACAALDDHYYIKQSQELVWQGLDQYYAFFDELKIPYTPSQTNFVLFDSLRDGQSFFQAAMKRGLLVRPMSGYGMPRHIRISVGTGEENKKAMTIMREVLKEVPTL